MMKSVYLDTTVPSYYYEQRPELALRRELTRQWWNSERQNYHVFVSQVVLTELNQGDYPNKSEILQLVEDLSVLEVPEGIGDIVQVYTKANIMPKYDLGDAFHLALASYYKIDFLMTWNCRNLANANKFAHIRLINTQLGLFVPQIITPEQLFIEGDG